MGGHSNKIGWQYFRNKIMKAEIGKSRRSWKETRSWEWMQIFDISGLMKIEFLCGMVENSTLYVLSALIEFTLRKYLPILGQVFIGFCRFFKCLQTDTDYFPSNKT